MKEFVRSLSVEQCQTLSAELGACEDSRSFVRGLLELVSDESQEPAPPITLEHLVASLSGTQLEALERITQLYYHSEDLAVDLSKAIRLSKERRATTQ